MPKNNAPSMNYNINVNQKRYGVGTFILDAVMTLLTGGFWLIWVAIRYMRTH